MNKKHFDKSLGEFIRKTREEKGITQVELSASMNINPQNISSYERGERSPSLFWISKLCKSLGVDYSNFINKFYEKLRIEKIIE